MLFLLTIEDLDERSKLEEIYVTYKRDLYIVAYSIVKQHEAAEDLIQVAMLKIHRHLDKINEIKCNKTRAYLVTIVRHLCFDYLKKDKVKGEKMLHSTPLEEIVTLSDVNQLVEVEVIQKESADELKKVIEALHPTYSEIIKLKYYDALSIEEISDVLCITKNNVSVRLKRAIESLKKITNERRDEIG